MDTWFFSLVFNFTARSLYDYCSLKKMLLLRKKRSLSSSFNTFLFTCLDSSSSFFLNSIWWILLLPFPFWLCIWWISPVTFGFIATEKQLNWYLLFVSFNCFLTYVCFKVKFWGLAYSNFHLIVLCTACISYGLWKLIYSGWLI